ncbi:hypothetical protein SteCoe_26682 [Stentor coeruleus]|uniref:Uncharacterized protein n=1 Tax=Stentor coeruleus TaxID=5963 RepID=A0A1R2BC79_9CILI|nr:hypothetical protein SteCoe_26682 [Stentor coeruleus]
MKLICDGDADLLVTLSLIYGHGAILAKKTPLFGKSSKKILHPENLSSVFVNFYTEFSEISEFLGNLHLTPLEIQYLYVDLNIAKDKDIAHLSALLYSLQQFSSIEILCILSSQMNYVDLWLTFSRYYSRIFQNKKGIVQELIFGNGGVYFKEIGQVEDCLLVLCENE